MIIVEKNKPIDKKTLYLPKELLNVNQSIKIKPMNKFFSILFAVCVALMSSTAWTEPITENQARNIAANFMISHAMPSTNMRLSHKASSFHAPGTSEKAAYYAFNASLGGYVIVSGDDRAPAVLGYSDKGSFDQQNLPTAMQEMLEGYAAQIDALDHGAKAAPHLINGNAIAPLVTAQWNQTEPYNLVFPEMQGGLPVVGCVATAMAQVMYYWKWPARPSMPIPPYTTQTLSYYMPQLPVVDFEWDKMQDTYLINDESDAALAASRLSLYCAQSVGMDLTPYSSGAASHRLPMALSTYFGYSKSAKYLQREAYTTQTWEDMVYQELAASRPVLYSGSKADGGHQFVCDGFDGNGMFHINWGWDGISNGYFLLSVLDPDAQGTGGANGAYGFIEGQGIIVGVEPGTGTAGDLEVTCDYVTVESYTQTRSSSTFNFTISQITRFLNGMNQPISFDYGWGVYDSSGRLIQKLNTSYITAMGPQYFIIADQTLMFGSGRSSGVYRIVPIYSERNANNWRPCVGAGVNNIKMVIQSNKCTVTVQGSGGIPSYQVNSIDVTGNMHARRPVKINLNVTNTGSSRNDLFYMFANNRMVSEAFVDLEKDASGNVGFSYTKNSAGTVELTFSLNRDGSEPIGSKTIVIENMPAANLNGTATVLNVTDQPHHIILDDKFRLKLTVFNNSNTTYQEDITVKLNKRMIVNYGSDIGSQTKTVTINPHQSTTLQFYLDNVVDGWQYYVTAYYYSQGRETYLTQTDTYSIYFSDPPVFVRGDVNNDGEVNISDVNAVIGVILGQNTNPDTIALADVDGNGEVNIADVNAIIAIILKG